MSETMTNEWPAIMSDYLKAMSAIEQRFQSGNEIPVPDARITRAEWEALDRYSLEDEARSTDAGMAYMHLEAERDALRAELLRLAAIEADALIALDCEHDWQVEHERAEKAEAELAAVKARIFQGVVLDVDDLARGHAGLPSEWRGKRVRLVVED